MDTTHVVLNPGGGIDGQRAGLGGYTPDYQFTSVTDWTLRLQQELPGNLVMELNYSGSDARHLPIFNQDLNRFSGDLIVNRGSLTRLNPNFGHITYASSDGNSVGHYRSAVLAERLAHGFSMRGIYTFGKALDYFRTSGSLDSGEATTFLDNVIQNGAIGAQRGRSDFDIRQQLSIDGTWAVPSNYAHRAERYVLGGWQFGGVWIMQSGLPFSVYTSAPVSAVLDSTGAVIGNAGGDYNADGSNYDVPDIPSFGSHLPGQSRKAFLTGLFPASAFPTPPLGQEGTLGRNTYDQPGYNNLNFTFEKLFHAPWFFGEKMQMEAKGDVFNSFNRANLTNVTSDMSSSLFGHATSQLPARSLQIHLRASF